MLDLKRRIKAGLEIWCQSTLCVLDTEKCDLGPTGIPFTSLYPQFRSYPHFHSHISHLSLYYSRRSTRLCPYHKSSVIAWFPDGYQTLPIRDQVSKFQVFFRTSWSAILKMNFVFSDAFWPNVLSFVFSL